MTLGLGQTKKTATSPAVDQTVVVQGACPQVVLREGTAIHAVYAKGAKRTPDGEADPEKLKYQATLSQTTRQCRQQGNALVVTVVAYGRVVPGPASEAGAANLPIRVAVADGETTLFSEMTQYPVNVAADRGATQFIFTRNDVVLPNGVTPLSKVFVGFDEGPYNTQ